MLGIDVPNINLANDLKSFVLGNNLLTTAAAVTCAFSTGTMIRSLVGDLVLPAIYKLILHKVTYVEGAFAPISKLNVDNFIKEIVTWVFVIILTFILIEYVIRRGMLKMYPPHMTTSEVIPEMRPLLAPQTHQEKKMSQTMNAAGAEECVPFSESMVYSEF